ncbi:MAG: MarR family transcriptional regulator [Alphaproteobacteria bacterium]|nr:MarR family transcriptional regulator [Alphaproteobacteria bacterium]
MDAEPHVSVHHCHSEKEDIKFFYMNVLLMIEILHRRLLDVIKDEFDRNGITELNGVQGLLLYNIGDSELTAGELRSRGCYLGSNVSYNLKKLVDMDYISHQRSTLDRRLVQVKLTEKGKKLRHLLVSLYDRQLETIEHPGGVKAEDLAFINSTLSRLERFWTDQILYRL